MEKLRIALWVAVAVLFAVAGVLACNDKDTDEQQASASKAVAGQQTAAQKPAEKPEAEEGEEGEEVECTPKVRHQVKGPATLNGGELCWCPDNSIPVN